MNDQEPTEHPSFTLAKTLPARWREHFPKSVEEANAWTPYTRYIALHRNVLVVAKTRVEVGWKACCGTVPGENHDNEWQEILYFGDDVGERIARAMFPELEGVRYSR